jgi:hypothetical protein
MNDDLEVTQNEAAVAKFKALSHNFPGGAGENYEKSYDICLWSKT